jgi:hypothetical protein
MKDPRRLLDGDGTEEQRALLRAAALEEPAPDGRARLLGALGVTAVSVGEASAPAAPAPSTAGGGLTAGSSAASATKLVLLALGSVALLGTGVLLWPRGEQSAARDASSPSSADESATLPASDQPAPDAQPQGSVALEIEALERVRSELARKEGEAALTALRRYASEHPHGALAHEADVLRVEALLQAGDAPAALQLAQQLLRRHSDSPHRARLEALARQASASSAP